MFVTRKASMVWLECSTSNREVPGSSPARYQKDFSEDFNYEKSLSLRSITLHAQDLADDFRQSIERVLLVRSAKALSVCGPLLHPGLFGVATAPSYSQNNHIKLTTP